MTADDVMRHLTDVDHPADERTSHLGQVLAANRVDRYVTAQAPALFLVAPQVLYAVNRDVDFRPYATTFELADTSVRRRHWSRRRPRGGNGDRGQ